MHSSLHHFSCVASGTFHQGNTHLFTWTRNVQCVANSACALAWKSLGGDFSTPTIDAILMSGDRLYSSLRNAECTGDNRLLFPDELPPVIRVLEHSVSVLQLTHVHDALYPPAQEYMYDSITSLGNVLEEIMAANQNDIGFLFIGQLVTVAFWRQNDLLYLFDPHAVNEERRFDFFNDDNNLARLFQCDSYLSLASLLLSNAALDGVSRQFTITQLTFGRTASQVHPMVFDKSQIVIPSNQHDQQSSKTNVISHHSYIDPKLHLKPVVFLSPLKKNIHYEYFFKKKGIWQT